MESLFEKAENIEKIRKIGFLHAVEPFAPEGDELQEIIQKELRPEAQPFGVSPTGGEVYVGKWFVWMGFINVTRTPPERDGGVDLILDDYLVQVKTWQKGWIGVAALRELYGVARLENKEAIFVSSRTLSDDAKAFADRAKMPVFHFSAEENLFQPGNETAEQLFRVKLAQKALRYMLVTAHSRNVALAVILAGSVGMFLELEEYLPEPLTRYFRKVGNDIGILLLQIEEKKLDRLKKLLDPTQEAEWHQIGADMLEEHFLLVSYATKLNNRLETSCKELDLALSNVYRDAFSQ